MSQSRRESKPQPPQKLNGGRFTRAKKLGAGCFGEVYKGVDTQSNDEVAIKTEDVSSSAPQLEKEAKMLQSLRAGLEKGAELQGFAEVFYFGREENFNCMVMELLGKSIEDMVQKCQGKFKAKTTSLIATQLLHRIEYLHSKGLVHRDIKPENFMFGAQAKVHHIYLIDFGLSKHYWDKKHAVMRQKLSLTGTARYASINAHLGVEQSRRDDLEAIGHMFMYFLRGSVPWSGLEAKTKEEKYNKIMEKKRETDLGELCKGHPEAFKNFLKYARELEFTARPDYDMLQESFLAVQKDQQVKHDWEYEWFDPGPPPGNLVPVLPRGKIAQPDDNAGSAADDKAPDSGKDKGKGGQKEKQPACCVLQ